MRHPASSRVAVIAALTIAVLTPAWIQAADEERAGEPALKRVPIEYVCMANDTYFAKDQIPVEVDGKTYYGCCHGCKVRLQQDESIRQTVDPYTGEDVDKATAVAAAHPDGSVLYFESEESFEQYLEETPVTAGRDDDGGSR